jgi:hypothetical protein
MNHLIIQHLEIIRFSVRLRRVHHKQVSGSMFASFIYLFIYGLFNDAVNSSHYITANSKTIGQ